MPMVAVVEIADKPTDRTFLITQRTRQVKIGPRIATPCARGLATSRAKTVRLRLKVTKTQEIVLAALRVIA
ncbi:hypothetical protein DV096_01895 [Bradymonadaceae bacterium TMQ3]|nr:hypothetical protein DV096_01895 [Bradymonadaceae bacterium TMQ3]